MQEKLGNMKELDWEDIWNGPAYRNIRRTIHDWNPSAVCRFCALPFGINGGDGNQYDKFFSTFRAEPVPLDADSVKFREGFFDLERMEDGTPSHCWMGKEGRIALPMRPGARFLRLRLITHVPVLTAIPGFCKVNDLPEQPFDNTCDQVHFPLDGIREGSLDVQLRMEFDHLVEGDGRRLALAVSGAEFLYRMRIEMKTTHMETPAVPDLGETATRNPSHVWFEPTSRCNTRCIHCGHYYRKYGEDMDLALYEKIAAAVLDDLERVELIGYGEPFMAAHFQRMFDDCAERGIEIYTTTNGILLRNDDLVSKVVRNRVVLCLSVDGARPETFETVRFTVHQVAEDDRDARMHQARCRRGRLPRNDSASGSTSSPWS